MFKIKNILSVLIMCISIPLFAQKEGSGIKWMDGISWQQVKEKAKKENKYIFVDCYASWCGPCKWMDKNVYSNDSVGQYINARFISMKLQMDTADKDDEKIKARYSDAHELLNAYNIQAYPTFLFFSPQGEILHKDAGSKNIQWFIEIAGDALKPDKQFYTILKNYESGVKDYSKAPYLASFADRCGDNNLAKRVAADYINNYLLKLKKNELYTKDNIAFITTYVKSSNEKAFQVIYKNSKKVNSLSVNPGFAEAWIHYTITLTDINPAVSSADAGGTEPDWDNLSSAIRSKYNSYYADRTILDAKKRFHMAKRNYPEAVKYSVSYMNKYGKLMNNWDLNGDAWFIAQYSKNEDDLKAAIKWMEKVVSTEKDSTNLLQASVDTYANLLYKVGEKEKAIQQEEKALSLAIKYKIPNYIKEFQERIEKMKKGEVIL